MTNPARPRGHLFVVQADMTRLAADAYVIPCDGTPELTRSWQRLVAASDEPASRADWFRPKDVTLDDGVAVVDPPTVAAGDRPEEIGGVRVLIDTVTPGNQLEALVDCALRAVCEAGKRARAHAGRARPLVAIRCSGWVPACSRASARTSCAR